MSEPGLIIKKEEEENEEQTLKLHPQPLHALHLEELNNIWPKNPSIPTAQSRRAWALARNLDPTKVHSWWWRRRRIAKKLRMTIPRKEYVLDIGTPPVIPIEVVDSPTPSPSPSPGQEESELFCVSSSPPAFGLSAGGTTTVYGSSSPPIPPCTSLDDKKSSSLVYFRTSQNIPQAQQKRAYTRFSKRLACARFVSPDTPSRTPSPPPTFPVLYLPDADEAETAVFPELDSSMLDGINGASISSDAGLTHECYPSFLSPFDTFDTPGVSECAYTHIIGLSCPDPFQVDVLEVPKLERKEYPTTVTHETTFPSSAIRSSSRIWNEELLKLDVGGPWCIGSYRFSVDGSLLGACSWCWGHQSDSV